MISARPFLGVFVLIKREIRRQPLQFKEGEKWLKRVENYVEKLKREFKGFIRIEIWDEKKVKKFLKDLNIPATID